MPEMPGIDYANAACVLENMVPAATDQGVNSLIWGGAATAVNQNGLLKKLLEIPDGFKPLLCASFGYAAKSEQDTIGHIPGPFNRPPLKFPAPYEAAAKSVYPRPAGV